MDGAEFDGPLRDPGGAEAVCLGQVSWSAWVDVADATVTGEDHRVGRRAPPYLQAKSISERP